jgi:hypothetical protein
MLPARIASIVALIPGRVARMRSGTPFSLSAAAASRNGGQLTHLAPFLGWTSPLNALTKEDQQALGLTAAHGKTPGEEGGAGILPDEDDDEPELGSGSQPLQ